MNKKLIIAAAVVLAAVICVFAFSGKDKTDTPVEGQPVTVNLDTETTKKPLFSPSYDKTVTVVLPIEFVDKEYGDDLEAFAEAKGYFSISRKGKTHVKIKMREYSYRLALTTVGLETISGIGYAMDSGDYPYFLSLAKYNSDFSDVVVAVDKEAYEKADNKEEFLNSVALYCLYYQDYDNDSKGKCTLTVCEKDTNILIETREFDKKSLAK
ncbi:MAG: hypothetical protein IKV21_03420 [Clostridia bacterium]|nr:hypothetical protein [Clostridia bacterium]